MLSSTTTPNSATVSGSISFFSSCFFFLHTLQVSLSSGRILSSGSGFSFFHFSFRCLTFSFLLNLLHSSSYFLASNSCFFLCSSHWHKRAAFQSVGVRAVDWQRRMWQLVATSGAGGTRLLPATPHRLKNPKWLPGGPKIADGVWKGVLSNFR